MKKIVILGCENSHANTFLKHIAEKPEFSHIEVLGVFSEEQQACQTLHEQFGVYVMERYDEFVGQVDGVVITARHGNDHYRFAKPYLAAGVPMFIDKPICISESEAAEFMATLKENNIKVTGGSSLRHTFGVQQLKQAHLQQVCGETLGGAFRAPNNNADEYGGFFFYSQHLVDMVTEALGRFPKAVQVTADDAGSYTVVFQYGSYTATGFYSLKNGEYFASRFSLAGTQYQYIPFSQISDAFYLEFKAFSDLMDGGEMDMTYEEFFAPVAILNAINRGITSGKVEPICY